MDEFIKREAALKKIDTAIGEYAQHGEIVRFIGDCRASVIYAPAADVVEVRHGSIGKSLISKTGYMCTACHSDIDRDSVFCKYCGAKMDRRSD